MKHETCRSARLLGLASLLLLSTLWMTACASVPDDISTAIPVEIVAKDGRYHLLRGGQPYEVKGAGLESGKMQALVAHGGNSFRTWRTDNQWMTGQEVLDRADNLQRRGPLKRHDAIYALRARLLLGNTHYVRGEWEQALQHYQDTLKADEGRYYSYYVCHSVAQVHHQLESSASGLLTSGCRCVNLSATR